MGRITDLLCRFVSRLVMRPSRFSKAIIAISNSPAHSRFCEQVYGVDLCQMNMMDTEQIKKLLDVLALSGGDQVLDVGCGAGFISEHIAHTTGAHVIGLDSAKRAIQVAQKRVATIGNLSFVTGDMNALEFPARHFDAVICIDTLYFVKDLESAILRLEQILKPGGRMGIFYSGKVVDEKAAADDPPGMTKLAKLLDKHGFRWESWGFTENELAVWRKTLSVAEDLRDQFLEEGNESLYASRIFESRQELKRHAEGTILRHLYRVTPRER
ncbi:class I SAM-dependent methyltransferase [Candidatus Eisenbacteria bacterium]|uniref:Class I SAM-dependent methyltransferase n=1 Tax=Eiseniibacteriota bacterium TaxID=2212470 RepID=A0ABV6YKL7_UNCEI